MYVAEPIANPSAGDLSIGVKRNFSPRDFLIVITVRDLQLNNGELVEQVIIRLSDFRT